MAKKQLPRIFWIVFAILPFVAACTEEPPAPVAHVSVKSNSVTLPFGGSATLDLVFRPLVGQEALGSDPIIFVHLLNGSGDLKRTFDRPLDVSTWQVGVENVQTIDLHQSYLAKPLAAETYRITVGLYEVETLERYALESGNALVGDQEYQVADLVVPKGAEPPAPIEFVGDWQVLETPGDTQVVARRWLGDGGGLTIGPVAESLSLSLKFSLPEEISGSDLSGSGRPHVKFVGNCGTDSEVEGAGIHDVVLTLSPPEGTETCEVDVQAESLWIDRVEGTRRSVYFLLLTLDPAGSTDGA